MTNYANTMRYALFLLIFALCLHTGMAYAGGNFVKIKLPRGVSIEIPRNWEVFSDNRRITLDTLVESLFDLSNINVLHSELPFAANCYDENGNTVGMINIRYYPNMDVGQAEVRALGAEDIRDFDHELKQSILASYGIANQNMRIVSWEGTQKIYLNNMRMTVLLTEYHRTSQMTTGNFRVQLVRVLNKDKSFTLTVSYHEAASIFLKPITDKIIYSLTSN